MSLLRDYVHILERQKDSEKDIELIQTRKAKQFRFFCACSPRNYWALFRQSNQQQMETAPRMHKLSLFDTSWT